jgi:hypothetical protein
LAIARIGIEPEVWLRFGNDRQRTAVEQRYAIGEEPAAPDLAVDHVARKVSGAPSDLDPPGADRHKRVIVTGMDNTRVRRDASSQGEQRGNDE